MLIKNRSSINICIDIMMFVLLMPIIGIGFLMKYVLVNGMVRNLNYGKGLDLHFWGMDRHQWGEIHLILSLVFVFLFFLHLIFHWKVMIAMYSKLVPSSIGRILTVILLVFSIVALAVMPLFVHPELVEREAHLSPQQGWSAEKHSRARPIEDEHFNRINGKESLQDISTTFGISIDEICQHFGIPLVKKDEKLGRLKRFYKFEIKDIRIYVEKRKKSAHNE